MKKKFTALALLFILTLGTNIAAGAAQNKTFTLTDGKTDLTYSITVKGGDVSVSRGGKAVGTLRVNDVFACSVYGDVITFYAVESIDSILIVYFYDCLENTIDSVAINADTLSNPQCFAADKSRRIYFVSEYNPSVLCKYENGNVEKVELYHNICGLLCVDGENIIIVTTKYTYLYSGDEAVKILDSPLSAPARYTGGGIITDGDGREYVYQNATLAEKAVAITEMPATVSATKRQALSHVYIAETGVTVSKIKKAFADLGITEVRKADGKAIESGKVGTGATVTLRTGETVTIIIYGELTGEGNVNSRDLKAVLNHLSEKELLSGDALVAADVDKDGEITTKDALEIALMY